MNCSRLWSIFRSPRSYKREATVSSSLVHHRVQRSSTPVTERDSPTDKTSGTDSSEVTAIAPDENKKTRLLVVCNRIVKWIGVARSRKGQIEPSVKQAFHELLFTLPGNTWQYLPKWKFWGPKARIYSVQMWIQDSWIGPNPCSI
jgi:hypothetical protein